MKNIATTQEFRKFVSDIIQKIKDAQYESLKFVNYNLICLYWDIGREICVRQNEYGWGKAIVEELPQNYRKNFLGNPVFLQGIYGE